MSSLNARCIRDYPRLMLFSTRMTIGLFIAIVVWGFSRSNQTHNIYVIQWPGGNRSSIFWRPPDWYTFITGGVLWFAWMISVLFGPANLDLVGQVFGTDYLQFYSAGVTLRQGQSTTLYNFPTIKVSWNRRLPGQVLLASTHSLPLHF
jgi:hypothetical protein